MSLAGQIIVVALVAVVFLVRLANALYHIHADGRAAERQARR